MTNNLKQWAWGSNSDMMIGGATADTYYNPIYMPGTSTAATGLKITDELIAVETGGHTSMNIKKHSDKFGYVGHYINGSMGNGVSTDSEVSTYSYETAIVTICGAEVGPAVQDLQICDGTTGNLNDANLAAIPSEVEWHATNDASSPVMTNITAVSAGTYYAFYTVASGKQRIAGSEVTVTGVVCCSTGSCNPNTFVNSSDPNTIEYDNIVSTFHSTIIKESDGAFKVWGQNSHNNGSSDLLSPTAITSANGFTYLGTPLRATGGSSGNSTNHQYALLTTDGLYVWGAANALISSTIKSTTAFGKITVDGKADGLPPGVIPGQVKMMFGSYQTLAIVTCSGEAWVLSMMGSKNGDGTTQNSGTPNSNTVWHRVRTSAASNPTLDNVVAMRGTANALFALTSDSKLYTWGTGTYINSGAAANRTYATEVSVPAGATPKMIGMTEAIAAQSYYLLATNGKLYTMGDNSTRQLGDGTTTTRTSWVQSQKMTDQSGQGTGVLENIAWISPNEHANTTTSPGTAVINVLTNNNKQWAWGMNNGFMYGGAAWNIAYDPIYMPGNSTATNGMKVTDEIIAVETGGHTTINIKKGSDKFGYVGHRSNGSIGDGTTANDDIYTYTYNTAAVTICGAAVGPTVQDIKTCQGTTADLNNANLEAIPSEVEWHATNDASSPVISNITAVSAGTYYAFYTVASGKQRTVGSPATVSYYTSIDTDNDGIPDICDLDDDNDGILDTNECNAQERITRGDFTTLPPAPGMQTSSQFATATGNAWSLLSATTSGGNAATTQTIFWSNISQSSFGSGVQFVNDGKTQSITQLISNINYYTNDGVLPQINISKFLASNAESAPSQTGLTSTFTLSYAGVTYVTITTTNGAGADTISIQYSNGASGNYAFITIGTILNNWLITLPDNVPDSGNFMLGYSNASPDNNSSGDDFSIGNISIMNCKDTDGDSIPDYLDLDSDNDDCLDAIEGDENVTSSQLVAAAAGLSVGTGSTASSQNLCAGSGCVDAQGVPTVVNSGGTADIGADQGQGAGTSANSAINGCPTNCYKPGITTGTALDTNAGITALSRAGATDTDNWPMVRKGGWIALEAKTKAFVPNRVAFSGGNPVGITPANFVEGMMVYDTTNKCLKVYTLKDGDTAMAWHCVTTQTCPD